MRGKSMVEKASLAKDVGLMFKKPSHTLIQDLEDYFKAVSPNRGAHHGDVAPPPRPRATPRPSLALH
jgi:hypothetical protein